MRDAIGGAMNIALIAVFIAIVSGYMAFNVNYAKAFKVKNKIITTYEEYEGKGCESTTANCYKEIKAYMKKVGYDVVPMGTEDVKEYYDGIKDATPRCIDGDYCAVEVKDKVGDKTYVYYKIVTRINMDIPVINRIMSNLRFFQVTGDTKKMIVT